ncbi:MAG: hypothetical protein A2826_01105 [Candidatus Doudnabacteria bacterium RIFCSPHIGHO2_01_FULL_43_23]|uniref:ASCH domain-containing protein n=1 Tax=Candidatus Doudnabacteria bacterium RIFCSPHIGHO2_01_FULL_43_23 TaxID=1817822 RepID=A0A1F5NSR4_9BACT|nr:MAG: hypothetical protein A2826_01105 [Candidatus Doudnabacteria bacterium RIFCSPHIGHO2_01_FULL_43_23]
MAKHDLQVKPSVLEQLRQKKTLEVRLGHPWFSTIQAGDEVVFNQEFTRKIAYIRRYRSIKSAVACEDLAKIWPPFEGSEKAAKDLTKLLKHNLRGDVSKLGVLVFELAPLKE